MCGGITVRQREARYSRYGDQYEGHGRPDSFLTIASFLVFFKSYAARRSGF